MKQSIQQNLPVPNPVSINWTNLIGHELSDCLSSGGAGNDSSCPPVARPIGQEEVGHSNRVESEGMSKLMNQDSDVIVKGSGSEHTLDWLGIDVDEGSSGARIMPSGVVLRVVVTGRGVRESIRAKRATSEEDVAKSEMRGIVDLGAGSVEQRD